MRKLPGAAALAFLCGSTGCVAPLHPLKWALPVFGQPMAESAHLLERTVGSHRAYHRPVNAVDQRPLHEQARVMTDHLREQFLIEDGRLFLHQKPPTLGDLCIWQGVYTAMAILRYSWDRTDESRVYAEKAFDGLAMLQRPGLPIIRGVLPAGMPNLDAGDPRTKTLGAYQWQEDASVDQASGWVFGMVLAERLLPSRQQEARERLQQFTNDLINNGFHIRNSDGTPTRWGNMGAGFVSPPPGVLLSMTALSHCAKSGREDCVEILAEFSAQRQDVWASYASAPLPGKNYSTNHNMAFLSLSAALLSEDKPRRWRIYARGMIRLAQTMEKTGNSFWIYLTYWTLEQRPEMMAKFARDSRLAKWASRRSELLALARRPMLEFQFPACKSAYERLNSIRTDLKFVSVGGKKTITQPLPIWQRPAADFIWQRDPYLLDDWPGAKDTPAREFTGLDFLVAYYLGLQLGGLNPFE